MNLNKNILALLAVALLLPASFATAAEGQPKKKSKNKTEQRAQAENQFSLRTFCANMTAAAAAGLAGGTFRALWWEVDQNNEYFWSKILASAVLLTAPSAFARKIGASESLADLALISGAVLAH